MFFCLCGSWLYFYGSGQKFDYEPWWFGSDIDLMYMNQVNLVWMNLLYMVRIVWTWIFWFDFLGLGLQLSSFYMICFSSSYFTGCLSTVHTAAAAIPTSTGGANRDFLTKSQNYCYRWWQFGKMDIFAAKSGHWPFPNFHSTRKLRENE